ncbi:hypothetical protein L218DRAFT_968216, partial [Marasmius fiardii PR-910]
MEAGKRDLETHTERRRPVVSAQRRVPAEIWEEISALVCSSSSSRYSLEIVSLATAVPFILGHVCSHWRDVVARSPKIWASIDVYLCDIYPRGGTKLVEIFLANSASYPLNLQVNL